MPCCSVKHYHALLCKLHSCTYVLAVMEARLSSLSERAALVEILMSFHPGATDAHLNDIRIPPYTTHIFNHLANLLKLDPRLAALISILHLLRQRFDKPCPQGKPGQRAHAGNEGLDALSRATRVDYAGVPDLGESAQRVCGGGLREETPFLRGAEVVGGEEGMVNHGDVR